jgi:hypothetical protein
MSGTFSAMWALPKPITSLLKCQFDIPVSRSKRITSRYLTLFWKLAAAPTLADLQEGYLFDLTIS